MRVIFSLLAAAAALVVVAVLATALVGGTDPATAGTADPLAGSEWHPREIDGEAVNANGMVYVRFGPEEKVFGNGGCNRIFGTRKVTGDHLEFSALGTTRMACPGPIMKLEARFLAALRATRTFKRDRAALELRDKDGMTIMRLAQADWD